MLWKMEKPLKKTQKKAEEIYDELIKNNESNFIVMADDSGLEVDYLNGEREFIQQDMQEKMEIIKRTMKSY